MWRDRTSKVEPLTPSPVHAPAYAYAGAGAAYRPARLHSTLCAHHPRPRPTRPTLTPIKQDGYRLCCRKDGEAVALWTRLQN